MDGRKIGTFQSDSEGRVHLSQLDPGRVSITEVSSPDGYLLDDKPREVLLEPGYAYFHTHDAYVLMDIDLLKSQNAELVRAFLRLGVRSLLVVPLLVGTVGVAGIGTHQELMEKQGEYAKLFLAQLN